MGWLALIATILMLRVASLCASAGDVRDFAVLRVDIRGREVARSEDDAVFGPGAGVLGIAICKGARGDSDEAREQNEEKRGGGHRSNRIRKELPAFWSNHFAFALETPEADTS